MGLPDRPDYLEAEPLKLTAEHFPLPGSLYDLVLHRYTTLETTALGMQAMALEDVIEYLRNPDHIDLTPMASIVTQSEASGDPGMPSAEQTAILGWLGVAFDQWEQQFPLEEPLRSRLRRLKPLAATLAITDPDFLVAGRHPLHRLLDQLQLGAVGWQARLGRAGQALEKQLLLAVEKAVAWFETDDTDLAAVAAEVTAATERDLARASRMTQRLVEAEMGRIKTAEAKQTAAEMINAALQKYRAPQSIGKFLKGPWYESAQLVLLKFGASSTQWEQMSATTTTLLESMQTAETEEIPGRRQQLFEIVTQLPRDLKRWLLSLQHDSDAVANTMGMLEYSHLQVLRKQPLALEQIELIPVIAPDRTEEAEGTLDAIEVGQWFSVDQGNGAPLRMRLALRNERERELVFVNQAGIKVVQQSFGEFAALLASGKVTALDSGASFSRCLADAAGLHHTEELDSLRIAAAQKANQAAEERQRREALQREREPVVPLEIERDEDRSRSPYSLEIALPGQAWLGAELAPEDPQEEAQLQREWDEARRLLQQGMDLTTAPPEPASPAQYTPLELADPAAPQDADNWAGPAPGPTPTSAEDDAEDWSAIELPMGTWLGFHDGDMPLLAKLAVHDRENNHYIFVNRSGIKMRELNKEELIDLMVNGLVDVLESRSNFRNEITRVKNQSRD